MSIAPALSAHAPLDGALSSATWGNCRTVNPFGCSLRNASGMRVSISDLGRRSSPGKHRTAAGAWGDSSEPRDACRLP